MMMGWMQSWVAGRRTGRAWIVAALLLGAAEASAADDGEQVAFFEQHIRPTLIGNCLECHGRQRAENYLRVDSRRNLTRGGRSGAAVDPGNPDDSLLIQALRYEHARVEMPPDGKLDDRTIENFEKWIADGAVWPDDLNLPQDSISLEEGREHWSYQPLRDPEVPDVEGASTPIDAFILRRLQQQGIEPNPLADRRTLIRRATYDLTGLPPTPDEIEAFINDDRPDAYERLIERLLASEAYGERWGRHWMDVARYADTSGDAPDRPIPEAQLYRDYIIDSFNADMPFDQFVTEQIAGDILAEKHPDDRYAQRIIATTFIGLSRRFGNSKFAEFNLVVENTIDTIGQGLLGQSLTCARCHDHKFDPIPEDDYYALYGFFSSTQYPHPGTDHAEDREYFVPFEREQMEKLAAWEEQRAQRLKEVEQEYASHEVTTEIAELEEKLAALRDQAEADNAPDEAAERTEAVEQELGELRERYDQLIAEAMEVIDADRPREPRVAYGVTDHADPDEIGDTQIQIGGDRWNRGPHVRRGFLSVITPDRPDIPEGRSGRLQLAEWLVADDNPLTPRVTANRIWHWHFGKGIVATPDNFGVQGAEPTHPDLLDYLASRFIESGWSFKDMHRRIMLSDAYRRASAAESLALAEDPDNQLLWRYDRRRLEAEAIRDGLLMVSGQLDRSRPPEHPFGTIEGLNRYRQENPFLPDADEYDHNHRSVYLMTQRLQQHPTLGLFDTPNRNQATGRRQVSTVALQSLFMMNSPFIREAAEALADDLLSMNADADADRLQQGFLEAYGRPADDDELAESLAFIETVQAAKADLDPEPRRREAWISFARVLFSSNEFIYLD